MGRLDLLERKVYVDNGCTVPVIADLKTKAEHLKEKLEVGNHVMCACFLFTHGVCVCACVCVCVHVCVCVRARMHMCACLHVCELQQTIPKKGVGQQHGVVMSCFHVNSDFYYQELRMWDGGGMMVCSCDCG